MFWFFGPVKDLGGDGDTEEATNGKGNTGDLHTCRASYVHTVSALHQMLQDSQLGVYDPLHHPVDTTDPRSRF